MSDKSDLLIVGGGALGAFHALHALRRGLSVTLTERDGKPIGATVRNFGQVVPSGLTQRWQAYGRESLRVYDELQSQFDLSVRRLGSIYIASDDEEQTLLEELHAINKSNGYTSELWTSQQCQNRYPELRSDYCKSGLYFPDEVSVNPRQMIYQLHEHLNQQPSFSAHFNTTISHLETDASGTVCAQTVGGQVLRAENAIVCCGSELRTLYPELLLEADIELVQLQMLRLKPQPEVSIPGNVLTGLSIRRYESFSECPSWNEIKSREMDDTFAKRWGIHILFKQELDGSIILGDSHEYAPAHDPEQLRFDLQMEVNEFFIREAKKIFDLPNWDMESAWAGRYCQTNDPSGIFRAKAAENIHIVTAIGGKGMTSSAGYSAKHLKEIYDD